MASLRRLARSKPGASLFAGVLLGFLLSNWLVVITRMSLPPLSREASCENNGRWGLEETFSRENEVQDSTSVSQRKTNATVGQHKGNHVYVGVMTAEKYLSTRAVAVYETWARTISGRVEFFTAGRRHSGSRHGGVNIPTVFLRGVTDVYPPQKKSFLMLKHMHDHFLDEYEWFVRADDDVYIRGEKLEQFLRSVNSSKPLYIGQPGFGKQGEFGKLEPSPRPFETTGKQPSLSKFVPKDISSVLPWDFITNSRIFTADVTLPAKAFPMPLSTGLGHVVQQAMDLINVNARTDRRTAYYREVYYGYRRVNPLYGAEYVLDLLLDLVSHDYIGENSTMEVRKHAYLQQPFSQTVFQEYEIERVENEDEAKTGLRQKDNETHESKRRTKTNSKKETIHVIVPVAGRLQAFRRFMKSYEDSCLKTKENVRLLVILFRGAYKQPDQTAEVWKLVISYSVKYPGAYLKILPADGKFSKGVALGLGASVFTNTSLLFFCDVDLVFRPDFLERCRWNTVRGHQAYFPVTFSQYDPVVVVGNKPTSAHTNRANPLVGDVGNDVNVNQSASRQSSPHLISHNGLTRARFSRTNETMTTIRDSHPRDSQVISDLQESMMRHYVLSKDTGYWRYYGFGMVCLYQSDFVRSGGFDTTIEGWGLEDVDLYDKFVKNDIRAMRVVDPGMVHVFHTIHCDPALSEKQYKMCLGARANTYGSAAGLVRVWKKILQKRRTHTTL
ncbi:Chondroitin sulfate synthase 1 [Branchiostoma belcheri]|nr:Chondroitin sulfate synthase 1 [Branchiostoma belcheri]